MTIDEFTNLLAFACFLAAIFRARWAALALAAPCLLILARWTGLVDISSASHPLRFWVPILSLTAAMWAGWVASKNLRDIGEPRGTWLEIEQREMPAFANGERRKLLASIIVFASGCTDIPALLAWKLPGEWVLVPLQILACSAVLFVLLAPERWLPWKVS